MDLHPNHHPQPLQQRPPPPPPPPQPSHKPLHEQELKSGRPIVPLSFANGALKKHRPLYPALLAPNHVVYRECMKNHAASLGGHALDGCGEFMPSPDATPADPASLTCAACGCHRNFHRRLLHGGDHPLPAHHPHREEREVRDDGAAAEEDDGDEAVEDDDNDEDARAATPPPPPPLATAGHQYYSAPHMLMALSAGIPGAAPGSAPAAVAALGSAAQLPRKRFRTKFSALQKEKMQDLSKRLGWRMQRRDEALVEECCREIGVSRGVFKVWMHNNKHNFVSGPSSRRAASAGGGHVAAGGAVGGIGSMGVSRGEATSSSGGGLIVAGGVPTGINGADERNGVGVKLNGGGGGGNGDHALNSSSPSS